MPELKPLQIEGIEFCKKSLAENKAVVLADRPGLGKTAQGIAIIKTCLEKLPERPILIIVPGYLIYNWLDELSLWGVDSSICVIDSTKQILHPAQIYITSYHMAPRDNIWKQLFKLKTSLILCDEGHTFRTWNSNRSRLILGTFKNKKSNLKYNTLYIMIMTGTLIVNSVEDVYNIIIRIAPHILSDMTRDEFLVKFAGTLHRTPWGNKPKGVKNEKELKKLLSSIMISRQIITGLPECIRYPIRLKLEGAALKRFIQEEMNFLRSHGISENDIIEIQKMSKEDFNRFAELRKNVAKFKIPMVLQAVNDILDIEEKPLIYCWHREIQFLLHEELKKKRPDLKIAVVNGSVPNKTRFQIVNDYQAGKIDTILATIGSLKEGLNITKAKYMFFIELPYTPAELEQVIARMWREGQENITYAKMFYFGEGIDAHLMSILKQKEKIINRVMK